MDLKAIIALRSVLDLKSKTKSTTEYHFGKELKTTFRREKKFLTHLVGSLDVRRASYSRLADIIHAVIKPKEPFLIVPMHERCEMGGVLVWVNTDSLESLDCYERLVASLEDLCKSAKIPYIQDVEKIKDYDICVSPI